MGRRGKGEGSVYKRADGQWVAQMLLPDGKRKYLYGKTRAVAYARLSEAQQRVKHGQALPNEHLKLRDYLKDWLSKAQRRHNLEDRTVKRYGEVLRNHVLPTLGGEVLSRLSVPQLRNLYDQKSTELAPSTLRLVHAIFRTALQDALIDELIPRNVTDIVKPAPVKRRIRTVLTPDDANHLLEVARGDRWEALYWLALNTAMRESELLTLRWADIDFTQRQLTVRKSKTEAGEQTRGLVRQVVKKLQEHKLRLKEERLQAGSRWRVQGTIEEGLVFPNTVGKRQSPTSFLTHCFYPLLERAELPRVRFHDLRHTSISWLLSLGIPPVDVAAYVGHADATTTLRIYAHSFPGSQQALVDAMEQALLGGTAHGQAVE